MTLAEAWDSLGAPDQEGTNPLQRWNDDRLDDLSRRVDGHGEHLKALTEILVAQAEIKQQLQDMATDSGKCLAGLEELKAEWYRRESAQRRERKSDLKWVLGTILVVATIIVTALGVFLH